MREKAIIFLYNRKLNKFLLINLGLKQTTLVQAYSKEYTLDNLIKKVKDSLGIISKEIFPLNWGFIEQIERREFKVMTFIAFMDSDSNILNKNSPKVEWVSLNEFIDKIFWKDNKKLLKKVLIKGINKEVFFDKKEREI